jgi:2-keto-4-pentenoate hydratase/2-oxohepta-3-ene-1,7-dioic acid hydratase in catechol pathway
VLFSDINERLSDICVKLVSYVDGGAVRLGALDDRVGTIDLGRAYALRLADRGEPATVAEGLARARIPVDAAAFFAAGERTLDAARVALDHAASLDEVELRRVGVAPDPERVRLLPPVPRPPKIVCVARNYAEHAREAGLPVSEIPILFARFPATLIAAGDPVVVPTVSDQMDWEGELAVVIGTGGRHVNRKDAMRHVAGYSIFNDVTVRDYQFRVTQYTEGKNFSATGPFGPFLALVDEIDDPGGLEIVTEVDGVEKQRATTGEMIFDIATLIEHISTFIELEPGDVIATGTPAGVGFKRNPPEFLRAGQSVSVRITGLGVLENPVVAEPAA